MSLTHTLPSGLTIVAEDTFDWFVMAEVFMSQEYEFPGLLADRTYGPLHIVDLGCNVGYFSLWIADKLLRSKDLFRITAIDASQANIVKCRERIWNQKQLAEHIKFYQALLGKPESLEKPEGFARVYFAENQNHAMNRRLEDVPELHRAGMLTQDQMFYRNLEDLVGPGDIDLLKCDIEGAEGDLIEAYPRVFERTNQAVFEFHKTLVDIDACRANLRRAGLYSHTILRDDETLMVQAFARR